MPAPKNLAVMQTVTTGTGNFAVTAVNGKQAFSVAFSTGASNTFDYHASNRDAAQWERGLGYMSAAGTMVRSEVTETSLGTTAKIDFTAGTIDIVNDIPAELQVQKSTTAVTTGELLTFDTTDGNVVKSAGDAATVFGNIKQLATTVASGVTEFATTVEAAAGTASTVAVTPAGVAAYHAAADIGPTTVAGTLTAASTNVDLGSSGNPFGEVHAETLYRNDSEVGNVFGWHVLDSGTVTSSVSAVDIDLTGHTSLYHVLKIHYSSIKVDTDTATLYVRLGDSGGVETSTSYHFWRENADEDDTAQSDNGAVNVTDFDVFPNAGTAASEGVSGVVELNDPENYANIQTQFYGRDADANASYRYLVGRNNVISGPVTTVRLGPNSGGIATVGRWTLVGLVGAP